MKSREIAFFTTVNLLNYLDRYLLVAVLPLIIQDLNLTNEQGGRLASAFVFGYFIFSPIFGILGDRLSRPLLMAIGVLVWSIATGLSGLVHDFTLLLMIRILVGIGEASFSTIAPSFLKDKIPDQIKLNNTLAIFFSAIPVGSALGYFVAGIVASRFDWHTVFLVGAIPGAFLALVLLRYKEVRVANPPPQPLGAGIRSIVRVPALNYAIFGYALQTFTLTGIATFVTKYGVEIGFKLEEITTNFGLILVATGFIGTLIGGKLSSMMSRTSLNKTGALFKFIAITNLLAIPWLAIAFVTSHHGLFLACCALAELLIFASTAPINSILVACAPPRFIALTQGVTIFAINLIGSLFGPIAVGVAADITNLSMGLQLTTAVLLGSIFIWAKASYWCYTKGK